MPFPIPTKLYTLPACLEGKCEERAYVRWLRRKAQAHVIRDRKRFGQESCVGAMYRQLIHQAVQNGGDRDYYTGQALDWSLISTYDNDESKAGRDVYLRTFANLPTVDHVIAKDGTVKFVICSWRVNDCKTHLSEDEFHSLCEQVLEHRARRREKRGDNLSQLA
jgi:hypothetical protein